MVMKKLAIIITGILIYILPIQAQDEEFKTIFQRDPDKPVFISGFGGPMMSFTSIDDHFAHLMGGGGGVIINNFFFGGYGLGLTTSIPYKNEPEHSLDFGHGGLMCGVILGSNRPVHLSISSLFGWGSISETDPNIVGLDNIASYPVFVVTPVVEVELNFSRFFKVGAGTSMSFVNGAGIEQTTYSVRDFAKPSAFLSFKFGWFN